MKSTTWACKKQDDCGLRSFFRLALFTLSHPALSIPPSIGSFVSNGKKFRNGIVLAHENSVVCDYFVASSIRRSIVHVSVASFSPTAGEHPKVECFLQKL